MNTNTYRQFTDNLSLGDITVDGKEYTSQWVSLIYQCPDPDKLVRVKTEFGNEYRPNYDEIGYGTSIIQFAKLNGEWLDDTEISDWCYIR